MHPGHKLQKASVEEFHRLETEEGQNKMISKNHMLINVGYKGLSV